MNFPSAVVFDLDGTLLDSEPRQISARKALYARYGMPLDFEERVITIGMHKSVYWTKAKKDYNLPQSVDELIETEFNTLIPTVINYGTPPSTGLFALLDFLKANNVRIACASSSNLNYVTALLKYLKIDGYFSTLVCGNDDILPKPNPDPYLLACKKLGVNPSTAFAVEDSKIGSLSAVSAGLTCIGYRETEIAKTADFSSCAFVADTMYDVINYLNSLQKRDNA